MAGAGRRATSEAGLERGPITRDSPGVAFLQAGELTRCSQPVKSGYFVLEVDLTLPVPRAGFFRNELSTLSHGRHRAVIALRILPNPFGSIFCLAEWGQCICNLGNGNTAPY